MYNGLGPEGQTGKLRPYVADIPINLWGRDLLQQHGWYSNIPAIPETAHDETVGRWWMFLGKILICVIKSNHGLFQGLSFQITTVLP